MRLKFIEQKTFKYVLGKKKKPMIEQVNSLRGL